MIFKFFLENTEIDEPVGFDATKMKLMRSENYHGIIAETDSQSVEFYGIGFQILKQEYDEKGIDASIGFTIKYACGDTFETLGEYSVTFYNSEWYCGDDCYCKVGLERKGCIYQLKNGMDTKVNLESVTGIDGTTPIGDYEYLGKYVDIPSKKILVTDYVENKEDITVVLNDETGTPPAGWNQDPAIPGFNKILFTLPFESIITDEFGDFRPNNFIDLYTSSPDVDVSNDVLSVDNCIYVNTDQNNIKCFTGEVNINTKIDCSLVLATTASYFLGSERIIIAQSDTDNGLGTIIDSISPTSITTVGFITTITWSIDSSYTTTFTSNNTKLYVYCFTQYTTTTTGAVGATFNMESGSNFKLTALSYCETTQSKTYMVNEALSKTSEYVTNGCLKVYSEFLGRTDSEPYNMDNDGCGGMLVLTKGELLRKLEDVNKGDKAPVFSVSFDDIIKALDSIFGIGYTIEQIGNDEVLRVEDWQYFYQDNILADIGSVSVTAKPRLPLYIKNFKTGYSKYEAEQFNGLDEFLTEREYTTKLVNNNNTLERVCKFIASGYAIELTRREGNNNTKDWRFDSDTFLLCMKRISEGNTIVVEQGNINNSDNIIDPDTILNYRISPARMAMNLFRYLTTFIKGTKELIFSNGKGNIAAQGELDSVCSIEAGVISEKQNLTQSDFAGGQEGIFTAELHEIENVPLTFEQYKTIRSNPHGLIAYKCDEVQRYGWIQSLEYSFVDGDATLILIPKNA